MNQNNQSESMNIEFRGIDDLLPYAKNSKSHSPEQVDLIVKSIERFGWTNPCLVADGVIIAGHGRILAAKQLKLKKVPCIDISHLSLEDRRAYVIVDNRSAEKGASWDLSLLYGELQDLVELGFDTNELGFDEHDMNTMFIDIDDSSEETPDVDPNDAPGLPAEPVSVEGDVWLCGNHRVMCGSSLVMADWDKLMKGEFADVVWTDPPYRAAKVSGRQAKKLREIKNDSMKDGDFYQFLLDMFVAVIAQLKEGAPIYVSHSEREGINFRRAFADAGFKLSSCLIWKKNALVMGLSDYQNIHEPILYGWKTGAAHKWYGGRKNTSVEDMSDSNPFVRMDDGRYQIKIGESVLIVTADAIFEEHEASILYEAKPQRSDLHPTQKPVELVKRMLINSARSGDIVIDAFGGSGTTMIAAEILGMKARLMELDCAYTDVIVKRWQDLTGKRAIHAETGEAFPADGESRLEVVTQKIIEDDLDVF